MTQSNSPVDFGRRVFQARLELSAQRGKQISQADIASEKGVNHKPVAAWERGIKEPNLATITRLASVLETMPEYLAFVRESASGATGGTVLDNLPITSMTSVAH